MTQTEIGTFHLDRAHYSPDFVQMGRRILANPPDIRNYLAPLCVEEPRGLHAGELREVAWPEDGIRDFRFRLVKEDRILAIQKYGNGKTPILLLPGTPGSRIGIVPATNILDAEDYTVYTYDRPGLGRSSRLKGRIVADARRDVQAIKEAFGIRQFKAIIGRSGGSPHGLACATDDLTEHVIGLGTPAPFDEIEGDRNQRVGKANKSDFAMGTEGLINLYTQRAEEIRKDPFYLLRYISQDFTTEDWRILHQYELNDGAWGNLIRNAASHYFAVEDGPGGYIDDMLAIHKKPWGIDYPLTVPIDLWVGSEDPFTPEEHTKWVKEHFPTATIRVTVGASHSTALELQPFLDVFVSNHYW